VVLDVKDDWGSWERYAYGEIDFWTRAEEFLARKANGEIEGQSYSHDVSSILNSVSSIVLLA
jgi:hypothetical protein